MWTKKNGQITPVIKFKQFRESHSVLRQLLPITYWQNGYVDIIKVDTIIKMKSMVGKKVMPFLVSKESHDIDYRNELKFIKKISLKSNILKKNIKNTVIK